MSMQQNNLTEDQLDSIYSYLSIAFDEMKEDEQKMWVLLLSLYDPEFNEDEENQ